MPGTLKTPRPATSKRNRHDIRLPGEGQQPKICRDGKWQLNLYDPDLTRTELMEQGSKSLRRQNFVQPVRSGLHS